MKYQTRLAKLERDIARSGGRGIRGRKSRRCAQCRQRQNSLILRFRQSANGQPSIPLDDPAVGDPCPKCLWQPSRTYIEETIIHTPAEADSFREDAIAKGQQIIGVA
jgi:hypothetical protein